MQTFTYSFGTLTCTNKYMTKPFNSSLDKNILKDFLNDLELILNNNESVDDTLGDVSSNL